MQALDKAQSGTLNDKTRALRTLIPDMTRTFLEASKIPDVDHGSAMVLRGFRNRIEHQLAKSAKLQKAGDSAGAVAVYQAAFKTALGIREQFNELLDAAEKALHAPDKPDGDVQHQSKQDVPAGSMEPTPEVIQLGPKATVQKKSREIVRGRFSKEELKKIAERKAERTEFIARAALQKKVQQQPPAAPEMPESKQAEVQAPKPKPVPKKPDPASQLGYQGETDDRAGYYGVLNRFLAAPNVTEAGVDKADALMNKLDGEVDAFKEHLGGEVPRDFSATKKPSLTRLQPRFQYAAYMKWKKLLAGRKVPKTMWKDPPGFVTIPKALLNTPRGKPLREKNEALIKEFRSKITRLSASWIVDGRRPVRRPPNNNLPNCPSPKPNPKPTNPTRQFVRPR